MKRLLGFISDNFLLVFFILLFLIKLTPFYYFPVESRFFASHTLAKAGIVALFGILLVLDFKKILRTLEKNKTLFGLLSLFLIGQSLSVILSEDIFLFWRGYHNILVSLTIFFLAFYLILKNKKNLEKITKFILISGFVLVGIELFYILFADKLIGILGVIIQHEVFDAYLTNIERGRYSLDMNVELFLPFFLWALYKSGKESLTRKASGVFTFLLIAITFFSNFRTRVVNLLFALGASLLIFYLKEKEFFKSKNLSKLVRYLVIFLIPMAFAIIISSAVFSFNILDRFALKSEGEDVGTLTFRINAAVKSVELFKSSPLFGVGLGNYSNYSGERALFEFHLINQSNRLTYQNLASNSPHNVMFSVLAETGALGITTFFVLLCYFFFRDVTYIGRERKTGVIMAYIVSFWTVFVFMLFNPSQTIFVAGWFWFLRGVIEASYSTS